MATYVTDDQIEALKSAMKLSFASKEADAIIAVIDAAVQAAIDAHEAAYTHTP
jgi:hypothetical protein